MNIGGMMDGLDIQQLKDRLSVIIQISKTDHCLHNAIKVTIYLKKDGVTISESESTICL